MKKISSIPFPDELQNVSWVLQVGDLHAPVTGLSAEMMQNVQILQTGENSYTRIFSGCDLLGKDFTVQESWQLNADGRWAGKLEFSGNTGKLYIEEVHFPCITMPFPQDEVQILVGVSQGWVYTFKADHEDGVLASGAFGSLRMTAAFDKNCGVYIDCRDEKNNLHDFLWSKKGDTLEYHSVHFLPCSPRYRKGNKIDFENSIVTFTGNWYTAAQIYRQWALTTRNYKKRIRNNRQRELALWLWNRGDSEHVIQPAEQLAADCGVPVALDWYWWHNNPYDTNYPNFWPPREGEAVFKAAQKRLKEQGIYCQVYINGLTWDVDLEGFEADGGLDSAVVDRDGSVHAVEFNCYTHHRLGYMCGEGDIFKKRMMELVDHLVEAGLPGIYMDMIGCAALHPCYNRKHHHAPGGGNYQARGYRKMIKDIRKKYPALQLSTESCNEIFMDCFESGIILSPSMERCCNQEWIDCFPVFSAVYHGANTLFGNYALLDGIPPWDPLWPPRDRWKNEEDWHAVCPDQFALELARTVSWGMQPTVCNITMEQINDPRYADDYQWIVDISRFYYANRQYLYDGAMLDPAGFECKNIPVKFLQRGLFTTEDKKNIMLRERPAVFHSAWQAPDGSRALILINYTREEQSCSWQGRTFCLPPRSCHRIII